MEIGTEIIRTARWCYDFELASRDQTKDFLFSSAGIFPFLLHKGMISLDDHSINLTGRKGKEMDEILLNQIDTIYLGYDELYPPRLTKNFGALWSPLRITLNSGQKIYLIIYGRFGVLIKTKAWFEFLKSSLAQ